MRMRLMPATIGVAGLLIVSKSVGLALAVLPGGWALQDAVVTVAVAAPAEAGHPAAAASHAPVPPVPIPPVPVPPSEPSNPPAPTISGEERQLLQDLRARREASEARDRTLTERESVLAAAEQRVVSRATELAAMQTRLEQLEKSRADREDANWTGLVKVYETMKPREAASIFNDMDVPVLLQLVDRMKETKAAPILAAMQPDRARLVTAQLAAKRSRSTTLSDHADAPPADGMSHS